MLGLGCLTVVLMEINHLGLVGARVGDVVLHVDVGSVRVAGDESSKGVNVLLVRRLGVMFGPITLQRLVPARCQQTTKLLTHFDIL